MTRSTKRTTLVLLGVVILFIMIIAGSLPRLEFKPGMPIPRLDHGNMVAVPAEEGQVVSISTTKFILIFIAIILTAATLYSAYQLIRGADWKLVTDLLRSMLIVSLIIGCLVFFVMLFPGSSGDAPVEIPVATPQPVVTSPLGAAPPSLLWLVGIGLLVASVFVAMWVFTISRQTNPMGLVRLEAEKARQALNSGVGLKDVIINCYLQMSIALKQDQGIERENFMTTGEFEKLLEAAGIPREPIHQLTQLFDAVRYGNWQPNAMDEQKAIQCLDAIVIYSRDNRGAILK